MKKNNLKAYDPNKQKSNYITYDAANKDNVLAKYGQNQAFDKNFVYKTNAASTNVTTRSPYYPDTYVRERPFDGLPVNFKDIVYACRSAYITVGVVRNVFDLLIDFTCEDIKIVHPDKKQEAFFAVWAKKVNLIEIVAEFVKHFLIDANVVVKRSTAKLNIPVQTQWEGEISREQNSMAAPDSKLYKQKKQVHNKEIPIKYSFLNIANLEWVEEDEAGNPLKEKQLAFKLGSRVLKRLRSSDNTFLQQFANYIQQQDALYLDLNQLLNHLNLIELFEY